MVKFLPLTVAIAAASIFSSVTAHPGEHHDHAEVKREIQQRTALSRRSANSLANCVNSERARALQDRAIARRAITAARLRRERGITIPNRPYLHRRDLAALQAFEKANHNMTGSIPLSADPGALFGASTSCILTPENVIGPYYVLGEMVRSNVTEGEPGVPMHLEMQFVDTTTCEPVPNLLIDIWAANSTGVYSGIDSSLGQGGLNSTYLRGVQPTDDEGVAEFETIFPGHYTGRATHEHVVVHVGAHQLSNGSYTGGIVAHIGQLFFDESLRSAVEATSPYNENTVEPTSNDDDMWAPYQADNNYDPFVQFVYLGDQIEDGLLAWISIGIDTAVNRTSNATYAAYLAADGGHNNPNAVAGVPSGGNGTMPSGSFPSGAPPSGVPPSSVSGISSSTSTPSSSGISVRDYNLKKLFAGAARRVF